MNNEAVIGAMKALTAKLSAVAIEFDERLAEIGEVAEETPGKALDPAALTARARAILAERRVRRRHLPAELFHEPAWEMLLALFVARNDNEAMNIKALVAMADAPVTTSQRWIEHLHKLRLINRVIDPTDRRRVEISLSVTGEDAVANYLRDVARQ